MKTYFPSSKMKEYAKNKPKTPPLLKSIILTPWKSFKLTYTTTIQLRQFYASSLLWEWQIYSRTLDLWGPKGLTSWGEKVCGDLPQCNRRYQIGAQIRETRCPLDCAPPSDSWRQNV
jgi:hypothetical protein